MTEEEQKNEVFLKQPFEFISKKWIRTVSENEKSFNTAVEQLRDHELTLLQALNNIESLEKEAERVKDTQKTNLQELHEINLHQNALFDELDIIEGELDSFINGQVGSATTNKFLTKIYNQPSKGEQESQREIVLKQAL